MTLFPRTVWRGSAGVRLRNIGKLWADTPLAFELHMLAGSGHGTGHQPPPAVLRHPGMVSVRPDAPTPPGWAWFYLHTQSTGWGWWLAPGEEMHEFVRWIDPKHRPMMAPRSYELL